MTQVITINGAARASSQNDGFFRILMLLVLRRIDGKLNEVIAESNRRLFGKLTPQTSNSPSRVQLG